MESIKTPQLSVSENHHFGNVFFSMSIQGFSALGFRHGDSVRIAVSNGTVLEDVPYYSGYYEKNGRPLLIAYPNDDRIELAIYCGLAWKWLDFHDGDTAVISLQQKGKYLALQQALSLEYSMLRADFPSDEAFANFRAIKGGKLRKGIIYRSASPCCNKFGRAATADRVMEKYGVKYLLDISDSDEEILRYMSQSSFSSPYFASLYAMGKCSALKMHAAFRTEDYGLKLARMMRDILSHDGPFLIYCVEGKDRTGFVCALLEAMCGAQYSELRDDYMMTYSNYYGIDHVTDSERYEKILETNLLEYLYCLAGTEDVSALTNADYAAGARKYLSSVGLTESEQQALLFKLTGLHVTI